MASSALHIADMLEAIDTGVVPGAFAEERTVFAFPTLSNTGSRGATHLWTIRVRLLDPDGAYAPITPAMLRGGAGDADLAGYQAEVLSEAQQEHGKVRDTVPTLVSSGKNLGKKNATNCVTQALRDALGLYNRRLRRGDVVATDGPVAAKPAAAATKPAAAATKPAATATKKKPAAKPAAAAAKPAAIDWAPPPMLVKKPGDSRDAVLAPADFAAGVTVQRKFNGVHLVVHQPQCAKSPRPEGYSRTGAIYPGQDQVLDEMQPMFELAHRLAAEGMAECDSDDPDYAPGTAAYNRSMLSAGYDSPPYFDGELYLHGKSLNWISGQARRGDDDGLLEFHVFDVFFPKSIALGVDMDSRARQAYLDAFFAAVNAAGLAHPHVRRVENFAAAGPDEVAALAKRFLAEGYEGAIARKDAAGYRYGYGNYHSANLLKIKPKFDAEFVVVGFTQGTRGKDVGAVVWVCRAPDGSTFNVVPKDMTYAQRYALFACLSAKVPSATPGAPPTTRFARDVAGLPLTVEYAELSAKTGKPLQAKALAFRTYEAGPARDPIRILLAECDIASATA